MKQNKLQKPVTSFYALIREEYLNEIFRISEQIKFLGGQNVNVNKLLGVISGEINISKLKDIKEIPGILLVEEIRIITK